MGIDTSQLLEHASRLTSECAALSSVESELHRAARDQIPERFTEALLRPLEESIRANADALSKLASDLLADQSEL